MVQRFDGDKLWRLIRDGPGPHRPNDCRNPRAATGLFMGAPERFTQVFYSSGDRLSVLTNSFHSARDLREDHVGESGKPRCKRNELVGDDRQSIVVHLGTDGAQIVPLTPSSRYAVA